MDDTAKCFLQMMIAVGALPEKDILSLASRASAATGGGQVHDSEIDGFVDLVNTYIKPLDMSIKTISSELNGTRFYVLINVTDDKAALAATRLDKTAIQYFKLLLERIVSEGEPVSSFKALNISSEVEGQLTKSRCETLLKQWTDEYWLIEPNDGDYSLGPRAMVELDGYIKNTFDNADAPLPKCAISDELCIYGRVCGQCNAKMHSFRLDTYFEGLKKANQKLTCPKCNSEWKDRTGGRSASKAVAAMFGNTDYGEGGVSDDQGVDDATSATPPTMRRSKRTKTS